MIKREGFVKHKVAHKTKWWRRLNGMDGIKLVKEITDWNIVRKNKRATKD